MKLLQTKPHQHRYGPDSNPQPSLQHSALSTLPSESPEIIIDLECYRIVRSAENILNNEINTTVTNKRYFIQTQ